MEEKCKDCGYRICIPKYLSEEYARIGLDFPPGTNICSVTKKPVDIYKDTCGSFTERPEEEYYQ